MADRTDDAVLQDSPCHLIRLAGGGHPAILIQLADMIRKLAHAMRTAVQHHALSQQLERLCETAALDAITPKDRADIGERIGRALQAVQALQQRCTTSGTINPAPCYKTSIAEER